MRKIINNKRYDTETAVRVGYRSHGYAGDFDSVSETLYRTRRGNWFLHGEGGAMSSYARQCGSNEWIGSEKILPLTEEEAFAWARPRPTSAPWNSRPPVLPPMGFGVLSV